eukprot:578997-Amphidinium_carterae.1
MVEGLPSCCGLESEEELQLGVPVVYSCVRLVAGAHLLDLIFCKKMTKFDLHLLNSSFPQSIFHTFIDATTVSRTLDIGWELLLCSAGGGLSWTLVWVAVCECAVHGAECVAGGVCSWLWCGGWGTCDCPMNAM